MSDLVNTTLGKYTLLEQLGAGGMGAVYRSTHPQLNRPVAIKVILGNATPEARQRFLREAQMAVQLSHPNIVRVFDVDEHNGMPYIVMEMIEGPSLGDVMRRGRMPLEQVLQIGAEVAEALDYAHRQGILHRDIKPGNVLLRPNGTAVLVDLGLARLAESDPNEQLTQSGMIIGTLSYMAPEQIQAQPLDRRTDIYALGILLFQMMTGRLPFEGDSAQVMFGHVYTQPPAPSMTGALLPPALDSLIVAMMSKQPQSRPQTMAEVAQVLRAVAANAATPPSYGAYTGPTNVRPQIAPATSPYQQPPPTIQAGYNPGGPPSGGFQPPSGGFQSPGLGPGMTPYAAPRQSRFSLWFVASLLSVLLVGGLAYFVIERAFRDGPPPQPPIILGGDPTIRPLPPTKVVPATEAPPATQARPTQPPLPTPPPPPPDDEEAWAFDKMRTRTIPGDDVTTWFNGTIVNDSKAPRQGVVISVILKDKDGKEIDRESGGLGLRVVEPGQKAGWTVVFSHKLPPYESVEVMAESTPPFSFQPYYHELKVENDELVQDFFPYVKGTVTNTGSKRAAVQVYVIFYDAEGNVLDSDDDTTQDDVLLPGATSEFKVEALVHSQGNDGLEPHSYEIFVLGEEDTP